MASFGPIQGLVNHMKVVTSKFYDDYGYCIVAISMLPFGSLERVAVLLLTPLGWH